jgi:hypothetical protein
MFEKHGVELVHLCRGESVSHFGEEFREFGEFGESGEFGEFGEFGELE